MRGRNTEEENIRQDKIDTKNAVDERLRKISAENNEDGWMDASTHAEENER